MTIAQKQAPYLIAHRGFSGSFPENTQASFKAAVQAGAKMMELDIQLSQDKKIIVFHDETLDRTTSGSGKPQDYSLQELQGLDCGSWFNPQFAGEKIPTLVEVLEAFSEQILINIEIKPEAYEPVQSRFNITSQLDELLTRLQVQTRVIVSSFEPLILQQMRALNPQISLALLSDTSLDQKQLSLLKDIKATSWNPDAAQVTKAEIEQVRALGLGVAPYTSNKKAQILELFEWGATAVFSDYPNLLQEEK